MVTRQVVLLRQVTGDRAPLMRMTLYNENSEFFARRLLHPPPEPTLISVRPLEQILPIFPRGQDLNPLKDGKMDAGGRYFRVAPEDSGAENQIDAILNGTSATIAKLTAVTARADELLASLPTQGRTFFNDNLRVQARFLLDLNRTLHSAAQAMRSLPDQRQAVDALKDAEGSASAMRTDLARGRTRPVPGVV